MNKKIVIKEYDKLVSVVSKDKVISEYIIYYQVDNINVEAYIEVGDQAKKNRVNQIILSHFVSDNSQLGLVDYPIEEISFKEVHNIK